MNGFPGDEHALEHEVRVRHTPGDEHALEQEVRVVGLEHLDERVVHVERLHGHPQPRRQHEVVQRSSEHLQRKTATL